MKEKWPVLTLLGLGAIILLIYLMRQKTAAVTSAVPAVAGAAPQNYPAPAPVSLGDIVLNAPVTLPSNTGVQPNQPCDCGTTDFSCGGAASANAVPLPFISGQRPLPKETIQNGIAQLRNIKPRKGGAARPVLNIEHAGYAI